MANVESANCSGVCFEVAKLMEEKEVVPEVTSGTLEMVLTVLEQLMEDWMEVTTVATSAGRVVLPMTKQAFAREFRGAEMGLLVV